MFHTRTTYIYIFWSGKKCKYVGKSIVGGTRPQIHFEKYWFNDVTKINIYSTSQRSQIPKLECLAIHRFEPSVNCYKPSFSGNAKSCPICDTEKLIKIIRSLTPRLIESRFLQEIS